MQLTNANALQQSGAGCQRRGSLTFGGLTALTLGGLKGSGGNVSLTNASSAAVTLTVGGNNDSTTYSGVISGTGKLIKSGTGALALAGSNTYTGGTTISAGTLQLGDGATSNGSISGSVTDNGTLVFADPAAQNYFGLISGSGSLGKIGAGTLMLTAANTFTGGTTIAGGTLQLASARRWGQPATASPSSTAAR